MAYKKGTTVIEGLSYDYDPNGNIIARTRTGAGSKQESQKTATYDPKTNRLLTLNGETFAYDDNGNLTTRTNSCGTTTYTWNAKNQLTGISGFKPDCSALSASFTYDALGRRTQATINGATTTYLYDGLDVIAEIGARNAQYLRTDNIDEAIARYSSTGDRYLLADLLGSTLTLTDNQAATQTTYTYSPYGETDETGESSDNPTQYTGRENDGTGLYFYRARYYAPGLAQFLSSDPIGLAGGWNEREYVGNNPVNLTDPSGLHWLIDPRTGRPMSHVHRGGATIGTFPGAAGSTPGDPLHGCEGGCKNDLDVCYRQATAVGAAAGAAANTICKTVLGKIVCKVIGSAGGTGTGQSRSVDCFLTYKQCLKKCEDDQCKK